MLKHCLYTAPRLCVPASGHLLLMSDFHDEILVHQCTAAGISAWLHNCWDGLLLSSREAILVYQTALLHPSRAWPWGNLPSRSLKRPESAFLNSRPMILLILKPGSQRKPALISLTDWIRNRLHQFLSETIQLKGNIAKLAQTPWTSLLKKLLPRES